MLLTTGQLVSGALLLLLGGELVVRGASKLALAAKLSPLFVGLTIVSFGTSAPELAVSVLTAWSGQADITLGNVIGSNLFNLLVILGACALVVPLDVNRQVTRFDIPVMIGAAILMLALSGDSNLTRRDGLLLVLLLGIYLAVSFFLGRREFRESAEEQEEPLESSGVRAVVVNLLLVAAGVGSLVLGCRWFVGASVAIAKLVGMSEAVIGLTIVSIGTSLPELVTSMIACLQGQRSIAIGNAVGSTTMNILIVLGVTACVAPAGIPVSSSLLFLDMPAMAGVCFLSWPILASKNRVERWEGLLLVSLYAAYMVFLLNKTAG